MNLKHLEYFITVAQMGSINRAAQALFISQPHLGKIIRDLEQSAGVPLFTRSNHGVTLTPEGIDFQRRAQRVLGELAGMFNRPGASGLQDVSLSVSMTKYSHIMESFIYTVLQHKDLPAYAHRLQEGDPLDVMEDVYNHRADVGVLHFSQGQRKDMNALFQDRQLIYRPLAHMTPHILISQQHPLLQEGRPVTLEALSGYGFVRYEGQFEDFTYDLLSQADSSIPARTPGRCISSPGPLCSTCWPRPTSTRSGSRTSPCSSPPIRWCPSPSRTAGASWSSATSSRRASSSTASPGSSSTI